MNPQQGLPLADIQLAEPVGNWPPAIGWWLLAAFSIFIMVILVVWLIKRHQRKAFARQACNHLKQQGETLSLQELNELLKITALHYCEQPQLAGLTGSEWHSWLLEQSTTKQHNAMSRLTEIFANYQYSQSDPTQEELEQACKATKSWLATAWRLPIVQKEAS